MNILYSFILIFLLMLLTGFFAGSETAFLSIEYFVIEIKKQKNVQLSLLHKILQKPEQILFVSLIGTNMAQISASQLFAYTLSEYSIQDSLLFLILFPVVFFLFADLYPKLLFSKFSYFLSKLSVIPFLFFRIILLPFVIIFRLLTMFTDFVFKNNIKNIDYLYSIQEVKSILHSTLKHMIHNELFIEEVVKFDEIFIDDIKNDLNDFPKINVSKGIIQVTSDAIDTNSHYFIVYEENSLLGYITNEDILSNEEYKRELIRKPLLIYEGKDLIDAITLLREKDANILFCLDEYGTISGIVTKEDIFEEIMGDFIHREEQETYLIKPLDSKTYLIKGYTDLNYIEKICAVNFNENYYNSISGYLEHKTGKILQEGDIYTEYGIEFKIIASSKTTIEKILLKING